MKKSLVLLSLFLLMLTSCREEVNVMNQESPAAGEGATRVSQEELDTYRKEFAQILAKSLQNENVREFLKAEASKQFDKDNDVLFQLVKLKPMPDGTAFYTYLESLAPSKERFKTITSSLPLLTIFVPNLKSFSLATWNTSTQLPVVAVLNIDNDEKKSTKIYAYDHNERGIEMDTKVEPDVPVVVLKDNERVFNVNTKGGAGSRIVSKGGIAGQDENHTFYFIDDDFNNSLSKSSRYISIPEADSRLKYAYANGSTCQRDYIYYNILNGQDSGPFNNQYSEFITTLSFVNNSSFDATNDAANNDPLQNWTEGNFEFIIDILLFDGSSGLKNINKKINVRASDLRNSYGVTTYGLPIPVSIIGWDYQKYGNTWKFVVQEYDPSVTTKITTSSSTQVSSNFKVDLSTGAVVKVGIGGGSSSTRTITSTTEITSTQTSDLLGEAVLTYCAPIISGNAPGTLGFYFYTAPDLNTGSMLVGVEPRRL